jgi:putative nucleotidyltransferase with HDIG domain
MTGLPSRDDALKLLKNHVKTEYTLRHSLASEVVMRALATRLGGDADVWGMTGLMHDLDLDEVGDDMYRHGKRSVEILEQAGFPKEFQQVVISHNGDVLGIPCVTPIEIALSAGETVTGMVFAMAKVLPSGSIRDVKAKSVIKRLKEPRFAAGVSRERIAMHTGLGMEEAEFVTIAVEAMVAAADTLEGEV